MDGIVPPLLGRARPPRVEPCCPDRLRGRRLSSGCRRHPEPPVPDLLRLRAVPTGPRLASERLPPVSCGFPVRRVPAHAAAHERACPRRRRGAAAGGRTHTAGPTAGPPAATAARAGVAG